MSGLDADADLLRFVADRLMISDVVTRYFTTIDHHDLDGLRACFTEDVDATYEGVHIAGGVQLLIDFCSGRSKYPLPIESVNMETTMHLMGNHTAVIDGDTAHSVTYAVAHLIDRPAGGRRMRTRGLRYIDDLVRTEAGGWLINRREHVLDWMRVDDLT